MVAEFYFLRHGETDHNVSVRLHEDPSEQPDDIPLNGAGRKQAIQIEPVISTLPIRTICCSPLPRAKETCSLAAKNLKAPIHLLEELGESTRAIWRHFRSGDPLLESKEASQFLARVETGLKKALAMQGPILIVSHGGVHFALCSLLSVQGHEWTTPNCVPVHFTRDNQGVWKGKRLV